MEGAVQSVDAGSETASVSHMMSSESLASAPPMGAPATSDPIQGYDALEGFKYMTQAEAAAAFDLSSLTQNEAVRRLLEQRVLLSDLPAKVKCASPLFARDRSLARRKWWGWAQMKTALVNKGYVNQEGDPAGAEAVLDAARAAESVLHFFAALAPYCLSS